jgi:hypothetical protein
MRNNNFFKSVVVASCLLFAVSVSAATVTAVFTNLVATNVLSGPVVIKSLTISAGANAQTVNVLDSKDSTLTYTNAAYVSIGSYVTNHITSYTNYYGVATLLTNVAYVQYSSTNSAATNYAATLFSATAPANTTVSFSGLAIPFSRGVTMTNVSASAGTATVTLTTREQ